MTVSCPRRDELSRYLDGELTENRASAVRSHVGDCTACAAALAADRAVVARIAAPLVEPRPAAIAEVMRRLDRAAAPSRRAPHWRFAAAGAVAAAAAGLALVVALPHGADRSAFTPRGGAEVAWTRKVGVEVWALDDVPRRLGAGERIGPETALVASYSNLDAAPAHLLAFAFDGAGEIHWLYPGFTDPRTDPAAVRLGPSVVNRALSESVVLEGVAPGRLAVVTVVTREPLHVSDVERLPPALRNAEGVRVRWPDARVDTLSLRFDPTLPADRTTP